MFSNNQKYRYTKIFKRACLSLIISTQVAAFFPWEYVNQNNQAVEKFKENEFNQAEFLFRKARINNPDALEVEYNLASSLYKQKKYAESEVVFQKIIDNKIIDPELSFKTNYNLGNTYYRLGEQNINSKDFWLKSVKYYQQALASNNQDQNTKENLEFVQKKLKELQKKKQNSPNNKPKPNGSGNKNYFSQSFSNDSNFQAKPKYFLTKSETEEILNQRKEAEESSQDYRYIKRRQPNKQQQKNYKKDW